MSVSFCHLPLITVGSGNMVDAFRLHILQTKDLGTCPVKQMGNCSFLYMRISNVYVVLVVSTNSNAALGFKFIVEVCAQVWNPLSWLAHNGEGEVLPARFA